MDIDVIGYGVFGCMTTIGGCDIIQIYEQGDGKFLPQLAGTLRKSVEGREIMG